MPQIRLIESAFHSHIQLHWDSPLHFAGLFVSHKWQFFKRPFHQNFFLCDIVMWSVQQKSCRMDYQVVDLWHGKGFFVLKPSRLALVSIYPPIQWAQGAISMSVERSGHGVDHSLPSISRLRISGAVPLLSLCAFIACTGKLHCAFILQTYWNINNKNVNNNLR
jgi:hypothetical protein